MSIIHHDQGQGQGVHASRLTTAQELNVGVLNLTSSWDACRQARLGITLLQPRRGPGSLP